jgi:DMSO/TMAO reductase YedYZ heme-binding membrane subunit
VTVGVLWLVSRAAGIVALVLLTATVVLGAVSTVPTRSASWPRWARQTLHRDLALLSLGVLAVHIGAVVLDNYVDIRWYAAVVPFASAYRPLWVGLGTLAFDLILVVIATSLLRVRLGVRTWRAVHWLTYAAWPVAVLHYLTTGTDRGTPWGVALAVAAVGAVAVAVGIRMKAASVPATVPPAARSAR